ncbi:MAG: Penicillin-binding protein 1C [Syntrophus sp. SKADARSKE-3]|nr:Penicillin-binding protein 1C [Syntrophus sp. SKADARSKE-3]
MTKRFSCSIIATLAVLVAAGLFVVWSFFQGGAPPPTFAKVKAEYTLSDAILLDRHGRVIHELRLDPSGRRLEWTVLKDISPSLVRAVIRVEDKRFYNHGGVDWQALAGAAARRLTGGHARGASTITMQLAAALQRDIRPQAANRTFRQKWRQMKAAHRIEQFWTKTEILEAYLNLVTFRGEVQGVAAASRGFFDKVPSGLDDHEALILTALLAAPHQSTEQLAKRACLLGPFLGLDSSEETIKTLVQERIGRPYRIRPQIALAPHVAKMLLKEKGQRAQSTLDGRLQMQVSDILNRQLSDLKGRNVHDGSVVVIENRTGDILAYVGNSGPTSSAPYVDGVLAMRQAGSTLKPFLYELALEKRLLTAASLVEDAPLQIPTPTGLYIPENYTNTYLGLVSVRTALASSLNTPAVRTLLLTGLTPFLERLKALGFEGIHKEPEHYGYSIALGSIDIRLYDLANAFRTLANGGTWTPLRLTPGTNPRHPATRVMDPAATYIISDILADREARRAVFGLENFLATPFRAAVKTGTSKDMRDNWCIGFSDRFTVAVWMGNFSGEPMWNVTGISGAAPVWLEIVKMLHGKSGTKTTQPPQGVIAGTAHYGKEGEAPRQEWFLKGTEPTATITINTRHAKPAIVYPAANSIITLDPDIPEDNQQIILKAEPADRLYRWLLNNKAISPDHMDSLLWRPIRGNHKLSISDQENHILDTVTFTVK